MTDARAWLEDYNSYSSGDDTVPGAALHVATAALLAVLDQCDRLDSDADKMPYLLGTVVVGTGPYYQGQQAGRMTAVADVRRVIDKALGVNDD